MPNHHDEQFDAIERRLDEIAEHLDVLRSNVEALHGAPQPPRLAELLELRGDERVLVVGDNSTAAALQADADTIAVHHMEPGAPLEVLTAHAPYDRVLVTEPTRAIAWDWVRNTRRGGLIVCVYDPSGASGQPVVLRRHGSEASGTFLPTASAPLLPRRPMVHDLAITTFQPSPRARHARTSVPLYPWVEPVPWFLATAAMPDGFSVACTLDGSVVLSAASGSRSLIADQGSHRQVVDDGPVDLFPHVGQAHQHWQEAHEPDWGRVRLTVSTRHVLTIDQYSGRWMVAE